jgi:hypothetical protein
MATHRLLSTVTALCLLGSACWLATAAPPEDRKPPPDREQIVQRIDEIQPTAKERRFDAIGWASGIRAAEKLAQDGGRPVFLFSNVGQMDLGRC